MICDNMDFEGNRKLIIDELLKGTELIPVEDLKKRLKIFNPKIDRRGIDRDHLVPLTKEGVIEYGSSPKQRTNKPSELVDAVRIATTIEALKQLIVKYPDIIKLQSSAYCQSMIAPSLLREIEKFWNITALYRSDKELETLHKNHLERLKKRAEEGVEGIKKEEWPEILKANEVPQYTMPFYFTEEDVLKILRLSPTALKKALEGTDIKEKRNIIFEAKNCGLNQEPVENLRRTYFQQMLLASLILDSTTDNYIGYWFDPELSIKIYPLHKGASDNNKFFHKKAGVSTLHPIKYIDREFLKSYSMV